jgi:hypothetical protein
MRTTRIALLLLTFVAAGSTASAQTSTETKPTLEAALRPGMTVLITGADGREEEARVVTLSGGLISASTADQIRNLRAADVARVRVRHSDSVLNGALIGAGVAVASGLLLCRATEPWENCRDDVGPMLRIGAIGAGIGIGIDALIRGRRTIYEAPNRAPQVFAAPLIGRSATGVQLSLRF